jgi:hypothetical protein
MGGNALPPDVQLTLEQLFRLFSEYISATGESERRNLQAQILALFSRLGVASDAPAVRDAAEFFQAIQRLPQRTLPVRREETLATAARELVTSRIRIFEKARSNPALSAGARQMLRIPVTEAVELSGHFEKEELEASLNRLFSTLLEPPESPIEGTAQVRTSVAVVRAFWKNFCRIPPFCSGRQV